VDSVKERTYMERKSLGELAVPGSLGTKDVNPFIVAVSVMLYAGTTHTYVCTYITFAILCHYLELRYIVVCKCKAISKYVIV